MKTQTIILIFLLILPGTAAFAEIILIPDDFRTIQEGIDNTANGDTVLINPGVYHENIVVEDKAITVAGCYLITGDEDDIDAVVIDGGGEGTVFTGIDLAEEFLLYGFSIRNGYGEECGGVLIQGGVCGMDKLNIYNNQIAVIAVETHLSCLNLKLHNNGDIDRCPLAGGLSASQSVIEIGHCEIFDNFGAHSGGVYAGGCNLVLTHSSIHHNTGGGSGGLKVTGCSTIERVEITDNVSMNEGAGGLCGSGDIAMKDILIQGNIIHNDWLDSSWPGGVYLREGEVSFHNVEITGNSSRRSGGGIMCSACNLRFNNVIISGNQAGRKQSGMNLYQVAASLNKVTISHNVSQSQPEPGLNIQHESDVTIGNSIVCNNSRDGIYNFGVSTLNFSYTNLAGGLDSIRASNQNQIKWGEGNVDIDPDFVDVEEMNFHLAEDSPCIDAGNPQSLPDPDGTRSDIGASFVHQGGWIGGNVIDATSEEALSGVRIIIPGGDSTITDQWGNWTCFAPIQLFHINGSLHNYHDHQTRQIRIAPADTLNFTMEMDHPELALSIDTMRCAGNVESIIQDEFTLDNSGAGVLNWSADYREFSRNGINQWETNHRIPVSQTFSNFRCYGVVLIDSVFYVSARGNDDSPNLIYRLSYEGDSLGCFYTHENSRTGIRGLAWDGELIWGVADDSVFAYTREGEKVTSWDGPYNVMTNITWDFDREMLWISYTTQDICGCDREGNLMAQLSRNGLRSFGLACWPGDPDGHPLYIISRPSNGPNIVFKMNPDTGDTMRVCILAEEEHGRISGGFIQQDFGDCTTAFIFMSDDNPDNGGDRVEIIDLYTPEMRMNLTPANGHLDAGHFQEIQMTFDTQDLRPGLYESEIILSHDMMFRPTYLPVMLTVQQPVVVPEPGPESAIPHEFGFGSVYPNPFNSSSRITYSLPHPSMASMKVYNLLGQSVAELVKGHRPAGEHTVTLEAGDLPSGLYFVKLRADGATCSQKIMIVR